MILLKESHFLVPWNVFLFSYFLLNLLLHLSKENLLYYIIAKLKYE